MESLEITSPTFGGIPALTNALDVDDVKAWFNTQDPELIPQAISTIKGLWALAGFFTGATNYKRPQLMEPDKTTITIPAGTQVTINGKLYITPEAVELDLDDFEAAADRKGKDMYVYACAPSGDGFVPDYVLSLNSTVPTGYDADTSRKVGGFHCLCADVGTIEDHPLSGYVAGDILPDSVWDLLYRAESENEGMVCVNGRWYDIYYSSFGNNQLHSVFNIWCRTNKSGDWFVENAFLMKKRLLFRSEFQCVAKGSNEMTHVQTGVNPAKVLAYTDTNGRRLISNYGLEACCGACPQWLNDIWGASNNSSTTYSGQGAISPTSQTAASGDTPASAGAHVLNGYTEQTDGRGTYNVTDESDTVLNKYGHSWGAVVRAVTQMTHEATYDYSGTRNVDLQYLSSYCSSAVTARLSSDMRVVNL